MRRQTGGDRPAAAVHFDPVNLVCSPQRLFANGELIREFIARLGPLIRSVSPICSRSQIQLENGPSTTRLTLISKRSGRVGDDDSVYDRHTRRPSTCASMVTNWPGR